MKLIHLKRNLSFFEQVSTEIPSKWVEIGSVGRYLHKLQISRKEFETEYALPIYQYFLNVIAEKKKIGDCPAMRDFVRLMVNRSIQPKDAFMICLGLKTVLVKTTYEHFNTDIHYLIIELYQLLDANFSGVLELFTDLYTKRQERLQEESLNRRHLQEMQQIFDFEDDFVFLVDENLDVTVASRSFLKLMDLDDVTQLNRKYPKLSFIEDITTDTHTYTPAAYENLFTQKLTAQARLWLVANQYRLKAKPLDQDAGCLIMLQDISIYQKQIQNLSYRIYVDQETGLFNKLKYTNFLRKTVAQPHEEQNPYAVFVIADDYNDVVSKKGTAKAIEFIRNVSEFLEEYMGSVQSLFRVDNDSFGYIVNNESLEALHQECTEAQKQFALNKAQEKTLSFVLVKIQDNDTVETVLHRMQELSYELKFEGGNAIIDDTLFRQNEFSQINFHKKVLTQLEEINQNQVIDAAFIYKGIVIHIRLRPLYQFGEEYVFRVLDNGCILSHTIFFKNINTIKHIAAHVHSYNATAKQLRLHSFIQEQGSPFNRHYVRVKTDTPIQATVASKTDIRYGVIGSLSLYALTVYIDGFKPYKRQQRVEIFFSVTDGQGIKSISVSALVEKIKPVQNGLKFVMVFDRVLQEKEALKRFITHRQLAVIRAYKARCEEINSI